MPPCLLVHPVQQQMFFQPLFPKFGECDVKCWGITDWHRFSCLFFFAIIPTAVSILLMGPVLKCGEQGCKYISIMLLLWDTAFLGKQEMYGRNHSNSRDYLVFRLRWLCECQVGTTHTKFLVDMLLTMRFVANRSCRVDRDNSDVSFHFSAMHFPDASRGFCFAQQSTNSFGT